MTKEGLKNRVLNGGRGSGQSLRLLCEVYENRIAELERKLEQTEKDLADYQFNYPKIKQLEEQCEDWKSDHEHNLELMKGLNNRISELEQQIEKLKCCYNCSKWNDGQCADVPNDNSYYSADFVCDKWEIKENGN